MKFVILKGFEHGNKFFSQHVEGTDPTKSATGETWYEILGWANTVEESQMFLYGRTFPLN